MANVLSVPRTAGLQPGPGTPIAISHPLRRGLAAAFNGADGAAPGHPIYDPVVNGYSGGYVHSSADRSKKVLSRGIVEHHNPDGAGTNDILIWLPTAKHNFLATNNWSFFCFVRMDSGKGSGSEHTLVSTWQGNQNNSNYQADPSGADLDDGEWHSVGATWNDGNKTVSIYEDGQFSSSSVISATHEDQFLLRYEPSDDSQEFFLSTESANPKRDLHLGSTDGYTTDNLSGGIGSAYMWSERILQEREMLALHNNPWWPFRGPTDTGSNIITGAGAAVSALLLRRRR